MIAQINREYPKFGNEKKVENPKNYMRMDIYLSTNYKATIE